MFDDPNPPLPPPAVPASPAGVPLGADWPCARCGYNLRGLLPEGTCPECGTPVTLSLAQPRLVDADPGLVRAMKTGAELMWWGLMLLGSAELLIVVLLPLVLSNPGGTPSALGWLVQVQQKLSPVLVLVAMGMLPVGCWLLTSPPPVERSDDQLERARRRLRRWLVFVTVCGVGVVMINLGVVFQSARSILGILIPLALWIGAPSWVVSLTRFQDALAPRLPNPGALRPTTSIRVLTIGLALAPMGVLFIPFRGGSIVAAMIIVGGLWVCVMALTLLLLTMLTRLRRQISEVIEQQQHPG